MEAVVKHPGEMPEMQRFVEFFWGGREREEGGGYLGAKRANAKYAVDGRGES